MTVVNCENMELYRTQFLDIILYGFGSDIGKPQNAQLVSFPSDGSILGYLLFDNQKTINSLDKIQESTNKRRKRDLEGVSTANDRFRQQSGSESTNPLPQTIPNPLICLEVGEAIIFQLSQDDNSSRVHYPVYVREHLLNSNPRFDYGAFRRLASFIQSGVNISLFVHSFSEPGTYYFSDSIITSNQMAVTIMRDGTTCGRSGDSFQVLPSSSSYMIQYGIVSQQILSQEPNLPAIFGILVTGLFILGVCVFGILIWRPKSVGFNMPDILKPRYRRLNEPQIVYLSKDLDTLEKSGAGLRSPALIQSTECYSELEILMLKLFTTSLKIKPCMCQLSLQDNKQILLSFMTRYFNKQKV